MKRTIVTLMVVGLTGVLLIPASAEAGIFGRWFGRWMRGPATVTTVPAAEESVEAGRRYSYEPMVSGGVRSNVPRGQNFLLPKTDVRRYTPN